jgi:hypothetical protein
MTPRAKLWPDGLKSKPQSCEMPENISLET